MRSKQIFLDPHNIDYLALELITTMANKEMQQEHWTNHSLNLQIQEYTKRRLFAVCPLKHSVILEWKWIKNRETKLGLKPDTVTFIEQKC